MYNTLNDVIENVSLYMGETKRMNCPACKGYNTFTITNYNGSVMWNCYKASCGISGGKRVGMTPDDIKRMRTKQEQTVKTFELPVYIVNRTEGLHYERFCATYDLDAEKLGLLYDVKESRIVFPIVHGGVIVDATGRALTKRQPKWRRYGSSGLPYTCGQGSVAVVVEDCVSASVVGGEKFVGVALLGTTLLEEHKQYLAQFSAAIVAMDPDALPKTMSIAKQLRGHVDHVKVLKLNKDLKYADRDDLKKLTDIGESLWN